MSFDGQVALVTGAGSSGMGRSYAQVLGNRGCSIAVNDVNEEGCHETVDILERSGIQALAVPCDITDSHAVDKMVQSVVDRFARLDILINNAGIGQHRSIEEIDDAALDRMMKVHVYGSFYCIRAVAPIMKRQRRGKVINVSSIFGMTGFHRSAHYCTAKAALLGLTKALALEFAPYGINVNAIAPGGVTTPLVYQNRTPAQIELEQQEVPLRRWAEPEEIAQLGAYLCSEESRFITGQTVSPNGGQVIVGI